ncbi:MAG: hypothetical protein BRD48_01600 [Bacteroidetes bacterium QS_9_68_14]|nr:MAG: hypothetical protein BRD48_01600 [Bacteroidetes bacterium QS_9_68_14]
MGKRKVPTGINVQVWKTLDRFPPSRGTVRLRSDQYVSGADRWSIDVQVRPRRCSLSERVTAARDGRLVGPPIADAFGEPSVQEPSHLGGLLPARRDEVLCLVGVGLRVVEEFEAVSSRTPLRSSAASSFATSASTRRMLTS